MTFDEFVAVVRRSSSSSVVAAAFRRALGLPDAPSTAGSVAVRRASPDSRDVLDCFENRRRVDLEDRC